MTKNIGKNMEINNSYTLWVEMCTSTVTIEKCMEKIKTENITIT